MFSIVEIFIHHDIFPPKVLINEETLIDLLTEVTRKLTAIVNNNIPKIQLGGLYLFVK